MKKFMRIVFLLLIFAAVCQAEILSSRQLVGQAKNYDKEIIQYQGEVIGEILPRGNNVWLNIHDGERALGVWADKELAAEIQYAGNYRQRGDIVQVTGEFHQTCAQHGGELDIHAQELEIVNPGYPLSHAPDKNKIICVIVLSVLTVALFFYNLKLK